jgi:hypothetical protein
MTDRFKPLLTAGVASAFLTVALARGQPPAPTSTTEPLMIKKAFGKAAVPVIVKKQAVPADTPVRLEVEALRRRIEAAFRKDAPVAMPMPMMPPVAPAQIQVQNIKMFAQQWEPQIRALLRAEYRFMRTVCAPTKEQRLPIVRQSDAWVKAAARQFAEWQMNGQMIAGRPAPSPDARSLLVEEISKAVKAHLTPEQFQRYRKEIDARAEDEKAVGVKNLVAKLDQNLVLSADQRDRIAASLTSAWDEAWSQHLQMFRLGDQYMPTIPDERIVPFLDPAQKELWSSVQKIGRVNFGINFGDLGRQINDAGPLDEDWPDEPKARP